MRDTCLTYMVRPVVQMQLIRCLESLTMPLRIGQLIMLVSAGTQALGTEGTLDSMGGQMVLYFCSH